MKITLFMAVFLSSSAMADIYKCEDAEGSLTYTELSCAEESLTLVKKMPVFDQVDQSAVPEYAPVNADNPADDYIGKINSLAVCAGLYFSHHGQVSDADRRLRLHASRKLRSTHRAFGISEDRYVLLFSEGFKTGMLTELREGDLDRNRAYCNALAKTELNRHFLPVSEPFQLVGN